MGKEKLSSVICQRFNVSKNASHLSDVMCSTRGLQHHLNVLMLGWYHGTRNGTFLSCNGPNRGQISLEISFGHRVTTWLIINVKLRRIIVQSVSFVCQTCWLGSGPLQWGSEVLYVELASALGWTRISRQNKWTTGDAVSAENVFVSHQEKKNQGHGQTIS